MNARKSDLKKKSLENRSVLFFWGGGGSCFSKQGFSVVLGSVLILQAKNITTAMKSVIMISDLI